LCGGTVRMTQFSVRPCLSVNVYWTAVDTSLSLS
jgi:hypothetical protein